MTWKVKLSGRKNKGVHQIASRVRGAERAVLYLGYCLSPMRRNPVDRGSAVRMTSVPNCRLIDWCLAEGA